MKINTKKTKVITFNKSRRFDFPPEVKFSNNQFLEVISETKLLCVIISKDLTWKKNTEYICQKARTKLWTLRRLRKLKFDVPHLLDVYFKEIRPLLELAVPVWHSSLTKLQSAQIERVQKAAFHIILDGDYDSYQHACSVLVVETLEARRNKLCNKFVKKEISIFTKIVKTTNTRAKPSLVKEFKCRTSRFEKSALPYLSRLVNQI